MMWVQRCMEAGFTVNRGVFRLFPVILVLLTAIAQARPPYPEHFEPESGKSFVFIGDETTWQGHFTQYIENYFYLRYPDRRLRFYNCGNKNDTAADVLARFDADLAERKPYHSIVLLGTWDAELADFDTGRFARFKENYGALLDKLDRMGGHPILVSPPMFDGLVRARRMEDETYRFRSRDISPDYNGIMAMYGAWVREQAVERGLRFADAWGPLNDVTSNERRTNPLFTLMPDSLHPDEGGSAIVAASIVESLNPERREVGHMRLRRVEGSWESRADGGSIEGVSGSPTEVRFLWKAKFLPWAVPHEAVFGVELARIEERFNREVLQVIGLEAGDYELFIAGSKVGFEKYSANELAEGLDLHGIFDRPNYVRAQQVANANRERYRASIQPWRDLWQEVKRVRENFPEEPEKRSARITELTGQMNAFLNQAREAEDRIYEMNQPLARNVVVEPYKDPKVRAKEAEDRLREEEAAKAAAEAAAAAESEEAQESPED